jgi:hypothetical protein
MTGIVLNLGVRGVGRSVVADGDAYVLRESTELMGPILTPKIEL